MIMFTDGSASSPGGPGGISVVLVGETGLCHVYSTGLSATTSPRAELLAVLAAVTLVPEDVAATIYCDCYYVTEGVRSWLRGWKQRGYRNSRGKRISHRNLWERLDAILQAKVIEVRRVRGHQGNPGNELADLMARRAWEKEGEK